MVVAAPVAAQVPMVGMSGFVANQCSDGCPEQNTACTQANINIGVGVGFGNLTPRTDLEVFQPDTVDSWLMRSYIMSHEDWLSTSLCDDGDLAEGGIGCRRQYPLIPGARFVRVRELA